MMATLLAWLRRALALWSRPRLGRRAPRRDRRAHRVYDRECRRPALFLIGAGAIVGSAVGITAGTVMQSEFVGLAAVEPALGLPVIAAMAAIAAVAALVPARRVSQVDQIGRAHV